jgi:hypothetical protein
MGMRQVHGRISTGYTKTQYGHYIVPGDKATRYGLRAATKQYYYLSIIENKAH